MEDNIITFDSRDEDELILEMKSREEEVTIFLIKKIVWALENNKDSFVFANLRFDNLSIGTKRKDYLEALETNLIKLEKYEEYELCKKAIGWIEYLKSENIVSEDE